MSEALLTGPDHIVSLATSGILINIEVSRWTGVKQDREISDEVTASKKADREAGRFVKQLFANVPEHRAYLNDRQTWYNWMQRETFPWSGSWRYLPTPRITKFMTEFNKRKDASDELLENLIKVLPAAISNEAFVQGDMFKREDYPDEQEIRSKSSVKLYTSEVPMGDWRNSLAQDLADDLTKHFNRQAQEMVQTIYERQKDQMLEAMQALSKCCESETVLENGEVKVKRKRLYDTTLHRLQEMIETFRDFNITGDTQIEEARQSLEKAIGDVTIEQLRNSDTTREVVKESVDDILKKFGI
jgi:hypothetical protein